MKHENETLPATWALDMAAKAAGKEDWEDFCLYGKNTSPMGRSIIAHARTLEEHAPHLKAIDEDLLIAREICARVAMQMVGSVHTGAYLSGEYDDDPELQFALSMLKRDPEALDAFRKEKGL